MKLNRTFLTCVMLLTAGFAWAGNPTFYGKATVTTSGNGKVYVATSNNTPTDAQLSYDAVSADTSAEGSSTNATYAPVSFYLFAKPDDGYILHHWEKDGITFNEATSPYTFNATSKDKSKPTEHTLKAIFTEDTYIFAKANEFGQATVTPLVNKPGDEVTLSSEPMFEVYESSEFVRKWGRSHNKYCHFSHWIDETGATVSTEPEFKVTVDGRKEYTAIYTVKPNLTGKGYYRAWSGHLSVAKVAGEININISSLGNAVSVFGALDVITNPYGGDYFLGRGTYTDNTGYSGEHLYNFYDDPSGIIHIDGTYNPSVGANWETQSNVFTDVTISGQGASTKDFIKQAKLDIGWNANPGYYQITSGTELALGLLWNSNINKRTGTFMVGKKYLSIEQNFDLCPVTEETMDDTFSWFGACPDPSMEYDGGWWSSMYTAFPYRLVEKDGHEAYIVTKPANDANDYVVLKKIENGVVPANTAVLIKCKEPADVASFLQYNCMHNNFTPLKPQNRLIPLEPEDPSVDGTVAEGNLLKGEFQLNKDIPDDLADLKDVGHVKFDENTMRVFGVNADGVVGFYKLAKRTNSAGETVDAELAANRAYLDLTMLPGSAVNRSIRLVKESDISGVYDITTDFPENLTTIYDIHGRVVKEENLQPGSIYIMNGRKFIKR